MHVHKIPALTSFHTSVFSGPCPAFDTEKKKKKKLSPLGIPGLETVFPISWRPTGRIGVKMQPGGVRDSCVGFPLLEISFVSLGNRPNALSLCLYHNYHLWQKQGGEQKAEYFGSSHPDPSFLPISRLV